MRVIRVFPRRTKATPMDDMVFVGDPPFIRPEADEVHVSVTFTWDIAEGKRLREAWASFYPTLLGGPAFGMGGPDFEAGKFLRPGYTITSRGCPNRCWFCFVPKREGPIQEIREIAPGNIVLDNNLTACSWPHIERVFAMLRTQKRVEFAGGLEADRINDRWIGLLKGISLKQIFIAFDQPEQKQNAKAAIERLTRAGLSSSHKLRCFVLAGFPGDTPEKAADRCREVLEWGGVPFMMLYRDEGGRLPGYNWNLAARKWTRPAAMFARKVWPTVS